MTDHTVIITGGRNRADWRTIWGDLDARLPERDRNLIVRHGACPTGADSHADDWLAEFAGWYDSLNANVVGDRHPADWATHGHAAGPKRNAHMVKLGAHEVLAYPDPDSKGTYGCIDLAVAAGIPVTIRRLPTDPPKRVQRSRSAGWRKTGGAVCVTRPGLFGNPFTVEEFGQVGAVHAFRRYLDARRTPQLTRSESLITYPSDVEIRRQLAGRDLACWCPPAVPCHADLLLEIANGDSRG